MAESHLDTYSIHPNKDGSIDLGCWQLNNKFQNVPKEIAFNCFKATDKAYQIYKQWGGFGAWSTYINKSYKKYE